MNSSSKPPRTGSEAASSSSTGAPPTHPNALDVALVRELLETAKRRHRRISEQVVEFGDDPTIAQFPVKDARRHDFALAPVAPVTARQQRKTSVSNSVNRSTLADGSSASTGVSDTSDGSGDGGGAGSTAWRTQLQLHVVHLLQRLRARTQLLHDFLLVNYEDEVEESARRWLSIEHAESEDESDDDALGDENGDAGGASRRLSVQERLQRRERVRKKRMGKNYAKLRFVFSQLHRVAVVMGEQLFDQVRNMVRRSVASGVLNREANLVRLESIYKLELRRQVTVEKLLETVKAQDAERRRKKRRKKRDEQHVRVQTLRRQSKLLAAQASSRGVAVEVARGGLRSPTGADGTVNSSASPPTHAFWDYQHSETEPIKSTHFFKLHALERVLATERRHPGGLFQHQSSFATAAAPHRLVSEQTEELIHEKLMAFIYNKSRETFPVWREPPESAFTREETLRQLKRVLPILMAMPLFAGLSVEQLIEFARVMRWRTHLLGAKVLEQGGAMEELVVVMDGKLDVAPPSLAKTESKVDVRPPEPLETATEQIAESAAAYGAETKLASPALRALSTHFGELGMLSKSEAWKATLFARSATVKTLVLSRVAFDVVLHKLFGGSKSRQALLGAQSQRPSSSPAASARGLTAMSPTRPLTAAATTSAKEKNVALPFRQTHEKLVTQQQQQEAARVEAVTPEPTRGEATAPARSETGRETTHHAAEAGASEAVLPPPPVAESTTRRPQSGSAVQHYPNFDAPTTADSTGGATFAHMFRLKWAQPIAFQMESLDALLADEWAPAFPSTSTLVDFLSPSSLASACLLFDKKNVLVKENLRSVCFHHQLLGSTHRPSALAPDGDTSRPASGRVDKAAAAGSDPRSANSAAGQESESGPMTLSQFSEARRRSSNNSGSRRRLHASASLQNLTAAPPSASSFTVMKLGQVPFSRSSFVSETSFYPGRRGRRKLTGLSPNNEDENENEVSDGSDDDDADELLDAIGRDPNSSSLEQEAPVVPSGDARDEDRDTDKVTRARKLALDSLMLSMAAASPRKSKQLDGDAAQEIIVKKYLRAANAHDAAVAAAESSPSHSPRRNGGGEKKPPVSLNGINVGVHNAHAPLPLRVELQRRMEVVLAALKMKPKAKLELVLKYTHAAHYDRFQLAVVLWEQALHYITKREAALASLWQFELVASDPRRHFRSLSTRRLAEQKERDALFSQLNYTTDVCRAALAELEKQCGDTVFFDHRTYADKMKKDYTELLFEVEQERLRMIYRDVQPSVVSVIDGRSSGPRTPAPPGSFGDTPETPSRRGKRVGRDAYVSTPPVASRRRRSNNNNNNEEEGGSGDGDEEERTADSERRLRVAGSATATGVRNRLANPHESIYVCIAEDREQEAALARQQEQARGLEEKEAAPRRRSSSVAASHRVALRVKLQRQAELDELTRSLQAATSGAAASEVRAAQAPALESAAPTDLALLQRALHHFLRPT